MTDYGRANTKLVSEDEAIQPRRKAPPPLMRESRIKAVPCTIKKKKAGELETSKELDLKRENTKMMLEKEELLLEVLLVKRRREEETVAGTDERRSGKPQKR